MADDEGPPAHFPVRREVPDEMGSGWRTLPLCGGPVRFDTCYDTRPEFVTCPACKAALRAAEAPPAPGVSWRGRPPLL